MLATLTLQSLLWYLQGHDEPSTVAQHVSGHNAGVTLAVASHTAKAWVKRAKQVLWRYRHRDIAKKMFSKLGKPHPQPFRNKCSCWNLSKKQCGIKAKLTPWRRLQVWRTRSWFSGWFSVSSACLGMFNWYTRIPQSLSTVPLSMLCSALGHVFLYRLMNSSGNPQL